MKMGTNKIMTIIMNWKLPEDSMYVVNILIVKSSITHSPWSQLPDGVENEGRIFTCN